MRKEFDWNSFKYEKIAINCKTEEELRDFKKTVNKNGFDFHIQNVLVRFGEEICYLYKHGSDYGNIDYGTINYYKSQNYTILEWSDYMEKEKEFTIDDIKSGYMVELVDGRECLAVEDYCGLSLYNTKTWGRVIMREDTKFKNESQSNAFYDIVKVYGYKQDYHSQNTIDARKLLWKYEKPKKELTIEEIEKELGYGIKIIGDK